jgi:hypothetical protein
VVTKRCRLPWLTDSAIAPSYMNPNAGGGRELRGLSVNEYSCAHGAQINLRDLTSYLTSGGNWEGHKSNDFHSFLSSLLNLLYFYTGQKMSRTHRGLVALFR